MNSLLTIFRIPELSRKILFTVICIAVYRIGYYVPLPVVDQERMADLLSGGSRLRGKHSAEPGDQVLVTDGNGRLRFVEDPGDFLERQTVRVIH